MAHRSRPSSSADRAPASGAGCAGSSPAWGAAGGEVNHRGPASVSSSVPQRVVLASGLRYPAGRHVVTVPGHRCRDVVGQLQRGRRVSHQHRPRASAGRRLPAFRWLPLWTSFRSDERAGALQRQRCPERGFTADGASRRGWLGIHDDTPMGAGPTRFAPPAPHPARRMVGALLAWPTVSGSPRWLRAPRPAAGPLEGPDASQRPSLIGARRRAAAGRRSFGGSLT
jgi:hypothetical protein